MTDLLNKKLINHHFAQVEQSIISTIESQCKTYGQVKTLLNSEKRKAIWIDDQVLVSLLNRISDKYEKEKDDLLIKSP
ncbi:hypothetical protein [Piscibacillus salipiscarius]|uniref:Uncharacterized protein n=1 Tax=Piscibacillus salipiscarius TaxID=299480 RepID=A0ABW5Q8V8_9BACI|nr:hypothetical protein [Piscibacillus salipiscarius]